MPLLTFLLTKFLPKILAHGLLFKFSRLIFSQCLSFYIPIIKPKTKEERKQFRAPSRKNDNNKMREKWENKGAKRKTWRPDAHRETKAQRAFGVNGGRGRKKKETRERERERERDSLYCYRL